jgi:lipopolysaccharide assembly outer membrane protein LptD (OstA)
MKLAPAALVICAFCLNAQDRAQHRPTELKHFAVATPASLQPVSVAAQEMERDLPYTGVVHLRGAVEIKTPVCVSTGPGYEHSCSGYIVLRADRADFHEDTGQVEASGNVRMTREPWRQ